MHADSKNNNNLNYNESIFANLMINLKLVYLFYRAKRAIRVINLLSSLVVCYDTVLCRLR